MRSALPACVFVQFVSRTMILALTGETGKSTAILQDNCSPLPCHQDKPRPAWRVVFDKFAFWCYTIGSRVIFTGGAE